MSDLQLGTAPAAYAEMRRNYSAWLKSAMSDNTTLSESDTIRWIWLALHEGAEFALSENAPMMTL